MSRLPLVAFGALVVATVGAFFVTQHLKVSTPLINGAPRPSPAVISPRQNGCGGFYKRANLSFYLQHRADTVDVYIVDQNGTFIRTLASGRYMHRGVRKPDGEFPWDGREDNGSVAPDGTYYYRVALLGQGRTSELSNTPVVVKTVPPHPVLTSVTPSLIPQHGTPVTIQYRGNEHRAGTVVIYRTDLPGPPRVVKRFSTPGKGQKAIWDGRIHRRPAPAGTYLVGLQVTDKACNTGQYPPVIPPSPGTTPHAGVTVRYLAAQPPLVPVAAGSRAVVYVDSRHQRYRWTLHRVGTRATVAHGISRDFALHVRVPAKGSGLYVLALHSGPHKTSVPLIVSAAHSRRSAPKNLVVLPALTWQGQNPVDDDGDGLPNTLDAGSVVGLNRPLVDGLPAGFGDEALFLAYLDKARLPYDLTTDLALIDGTGPRLSSHKGVILAGSENWLPSTLGTALRSFVQGGGHALSIGIGSLRRGVRIQGTRALDPTGPSTTDTFGARAGSAVTRNSDLISVIHDGLGIFSTTSGAFTGFRSFQPITSVAPPAQPISSDAGTSDSTKSIVGYRLGRGIVVEIGLEGFGASLAHKNFDAQELVGRLWRVLSGA
jgi:flagellar hook capping protein FlgD